VDLDLLDKAVDLRRQRWETEGVSWEIVRGPPTMNPASSLRAKAPTAVAELTLWVSGEADLSHTKLGPILTEPKVEHYEITSQLGLDGCLSDFERHLGLDSDEQWLLDSGFRVETEQVESDLFWVHLVPLDEPQGRLPSGAV
jgi:hypothetical protein